MKTIFNETKIGTMTLKNRIIRAAIGDHDADEKRHIGQRDIVGYEAVAKGGVGTIITGYSCRMLEEAGASALEISGAWMNYKQDTPYFLDQTITVSEEVKIPVCLVGGVRGQETIAQQDTPYAPKPVMWVRFPPEST